MVAPLHYNVYLFFLKLLFYLVQDITCNHSNQNMQKQHTPHILFVGDTGVGKTTLIGSMSGHYLDPKATKPTIKSDFVAKQFTIGGSSNRMTLDAKLFDQQFEMRGSPPSIMRYCVC